MRTDETCATTPRLQETGSVPPQSLSLALEHIAAGGVLAVPSYSRWIILDGKTVAKFEKAGQWLIKEEGNCYRIRQGKGSVCILPGQLKFTRYQKRA